MDAIESLLLYHTCCDIGISSSQWERNIRFADCVNTLDNIPSTNYTPVELILCGSKSEGICIFSSIWSHLGTSSDVDRISIVRGINVQEHVDTTNTNQSEVLQMLYTDSPEHVLLEVKYYDRACNTFNNQPFSWILQLLKRKYNKYLVSSSRLKARFKRHVDKKTSFSPSIPLSRFSNVQHASLFPLASRKTTIHGPAIMLEKCVPLSKLSVDVVTGLRCYEWPTAAHEWIHRARPNGWPSQDMIDQIKKDGCELVPVGRKYHPDEDVEWKLSFSQAETRLIRNFNIYQAQCYQLLKIVKQHFISSVVADSLSSYHIKTVMLHTVEQTDPEVWREDNIAQCFMMCLSNLKRYLTDTFLPQYFIIKQNLLEPKVTGDVHQKVLEIVTNLHKIGWKCVLQCLPLQDICQSIIQETVNGVSYNFVTYALGENVNLIAGVCSSLLVGFVMEVDPVSYNFNLIKNVFFCEKTFLKPTTLHPSVETVRMVQLLRKSEIGLLLTVIRAMAHPDLQPDIDPMMSFARQCLEESCHADVSSCRLEFATFFFHLGEYDRCIAIVHDVLERFKDVWIVVGGVASNQERIKTIETFKWKLDRVLQLSDNGFPFTSNHLSFPACFKRWEVAVAPTGVHFLHETMHRGNELISESCCIDSIVYAHYLLLESYLKIEEYDIAKYALDNMQQSIRNGKHDMFDRNCLCFCKEDNLLLQYSADSLMKVAKNVKDK